MPSPADSSRCAGLVVDRGLVLPVGRSDPVRLAGVSPPIGTCVALDVDGDTFTIRDVLAEAGTPDATMLPLAFAVGVDPVFPASVEAETAALLANPGIDDPRLVDLTHLPFVTIDDVSSRDLDQALFVERDGPGHCLWYALADASAFARPGTALFEHALQRGSSYYLPGLSIPMLPRPLSEGIISLGANVFRRAVVFRLRIDADGRCRETTIVRAKVRSRAKLDFDGVQELFDGRSRATWPDDVRRSLEAFAEVGRVRYAFGDERDIVRYRRTELSVTLDDGPPVRFVMAADPRCDVEVYNEQVSVLCNTEGARILRRLDRPSDDVRPVYRVHPAPDPQRLAEFERYLAHLVRAHDRQADRWGWRRGEGRSLAQYLAQLPADGADAALSATIHRQALLANGRSTFCTEPGRHFGVGASLYSRFTAPMREIVGIFVHREALRLTKLATAAERAPADLELADRVVAAAERSRDLQKRLTKQANALALDALLRHDEARSGSRVGTIVGIEPRCLHVLLDDPPVDVKVYLDGLMASETDSILRSSGDRSRNLHPDPEGTELRDTAGRVRLLAGQRVALRTRQRRNGRWLFDVDVRPR